MSNGAAQDDTLRQESDQITKTSGCICLPEAEIDRDAWVVVLMGLVFLLSHQNAVRYEIRTRAGMTGPRGRATSADVAGGCA